MALARKCANISLKERVGLLANGERGYFLWVPSPSIKSVKVTSYNIKLLHMNYVVQ